MSAILPHEVAEGYRLSPPQLRQWRLRQAASDVDAGVQCCVRVRGPLDVSRLSAAVSRVRGRHDILRTRVARLEGTGVPVQVAADDRGDGLDEAIDLAARRDDERAAAVEETRSSRWRQLRRGGEHADATFVLLRLGDQEHEIVITASALCADAAGLMIVAREMASEYVRPGSPDEERLQYADLSEWQNQLLEDAPAEEHAPYWKQPAFSERSFPRLPFERCHAGAGVSTRDRLTVPVAASVAALLRQTASLRATLLTAWGIVLQRLSRTDRFLIGVQIDGRSEPELRDAVGPLTRTLPIALEIDGRTSLDSHVARIVHALEMAAYDQFMFAWEPFGVPAASERRHLFPLLVAMRETHPFDVPGPLTWEPHSVIEELEPCDLAMTLVDTGAELCVELAWDPAVHARVDMHIVAELYVALLEGMARGEARSIEDLHWPVAPVARVAPAAGEFSPVHEQIAAHARRTPDDVAIVCGAQGVTYGELAARAAGLSDRLRELGVGRESIVAIVAERSIEFFVGMLAALQAGGAWLPIDPDTPAERILDMLEQTRAAAVLMQQGFTPPPGLDGVPVLPLHAPALAPSAPRERAAASSPHDLAYVIFTSGSTGRPKGVAIEHGHLAAYLQASAADERVRDSRHFALVSTVAADLGHTAVFGALCTGGCLHVLSQAHTSDADALAGYFRRHRVDAIKIVPAHLEALCSSFADDVRLPWRCAIVGGEPLAWSLVDRVERAAPGCAVINEYGPTETTVGVIAARVDRASEPFLGACAPIGRGMAGTQAYVLDRDLRPVPAWLEGELFIGGATVGRGYVGRGDLTAERFIPDPFSHDPGLRMYRTGDRARRRSDGALEFLGRRDHQVKIRGYRVELEEIEAVLGAHPDVRTAAASVVEGVGTSGQLVAWAAVGESLVTAADLRAFLETRLPPFMIPASIVRLDRLALTPNGKVDRRALSVPAPPAPPRRRPPADDVEWHLVRVWQQALNVEEVGVDDNYFALGGDSLRVIQLVQEARRAGITIAAVDVLRHQTIRTLRAALLERHHHVLFPDGVPPLPPLPADVANRLPKDVVDAYPLSGMQRLMLERYELNVGAQGVYHIQESLRLTDDDLSLEVLEQAFAAVVQRHPVLRTVFDLESDPPLQLVRRQVPWAMRIVDLSWFGPAEQDACFFEALREDRRHRFDPTDREGPHFRLTIFLRSPNDFELSFSAHHAVLDGWGHRVMANQLFEAYADLKAGREPSLGAPDTTYREFVAFQDAISRSPQSSSFWRSYLAGVDLPPRASRTNTGVEQPMIMIPFGPELREGLEAVARRAVIPLKALVLGSWLHALHEWSGRSVLTTGTITNGRSEYLTEPLSAVGMFWNIVPLVSRALLPPLEQAIAVQLNLNEIEPHVAYPLSQIVADQGGREPFSSCLRYLHFWNARQPPQTSGLRLVDIVACDRYEFPLDCTTLMNTWNSGGWIILQYDPDTLPEARALDVLARYRATLHEVAGVAAPVMN